MEQQAKNNSHLELNPHPTPTSSARFSDSGQKITMADVEARIEAALESAKQIRAL